MALPSVVNRIFPCIRRSCRGNASPDRTVRSYTQVTPSFDDILFNYTSGRYNEQKRFSERRLVFDVAALKDAAARAVGQSAHDVRALRKLAEGGFNRTFEITMKDGSQIIARLPYYSTYPKRFAVASEVATLDLVRSYGVPVPKIYGYSTDAANPVGAEYIFMEKVPGKELGDMWYTLPEGERIRMMVRIAKLEGILFSVPLPAYGSLYYARDLPTGMKSIPVPNREDLKGLCIGPYVNQAWWFGERANLNVERGPSTTPVEAMLAGAKRELAWLKQYGRPRYPNDRLWREIFQYQKSRPEEQIANLQLYLQIAPYLIPEDSELLAPVLRHPDLNPNNIFISKDYKIVGLIDWQHCSILPLFLQAQIPRYFQNFGDEFSRTTEKPTLPDNFEQLEEHEKAAALEQYRRRQVHLFYMAGTSKHNKVHFRACTRPAGLFAPRIFSHASAPWEGDNVTLKADIVNAIQHWDRVTGGRAGECPISIPEHEAEECLRLAALMEEADGYNEILRNRMGISADGWVAVEDYDRAVREHDIIKQSMLGDADDDNEREMMRRHWPWDDQDEDE